MIWWLPFWLACATIDPLSLRSVCENVALSSFLEADSETDAWPTWVRSWIFVLNIVRGRTVVPRREGLSGRCYVSRFHG
jgi:hypothetical protein